jgi:hypothetical protein
MFPTKKDYEELKISREYMGFRTYNKIDIHPYVGIKQDYDKIGYALLLIKYSYIQSVVT